jgi:uncharacterized FlaG/YvyC family protein
MTKNLAIRENHGISISLDFEDTTKEISVSVKSETENFVMREIPHKLALDVFNHPYAYADRLVTAGTFAGVA